MTANVKEGRVYCSGLSMQAGETLFGTATPTDVYLLLEYPGAWGKKAVPESDLPEVVKQFLAGLEVEQPGIKVLLIRRPGGRQGSGFNFFIAQAREVDPVLYAFHLDAYEDLLSLDVRALLEGASEYQQSRREVPLLLVCTHGRRDVCCSRKGIPAFNALEAAAGEDAAAMVWKSSHMGGHRFAANVICLPYGLSYGRVAASDAQDILETCLRDEVHLPNLRGRSCYQKIVQAAEYYLREASEEASLKAFRLMDANQDGAGEWVVRFSARKTGDLHHLSLAVEETSTQVYQGCALDKAAMLKNYILRSYEAR